MDVANLPLAPLLATAAETTPTALKAGRIEGAPGALQIRVDADPRRRETALSDRDQQVARRHLRTLCEDLDELLGQVGEAARHHHVEAAAPLFIAAVAIAAELAWRLPGREVQQNAAAARVCVDVLDEADVLRTLGLLTELDAELDRTARGDGTARAPEMARALLARIDTLGRASASGRTRS